MIFELKNNMKGMISMKSHWIVKLKNPLNGISLAIYDDGRVYIDKTGPLIGTLKTRFLKKIKFYIHEYVHYIKIYGYEIQDRCSFITKFWDSSLKKRDNLAVKGWLYEKDTAVILMNQNAYRDLKLEERELAALLYEWLEPLYTD